MHIAIVGSRGYLFLDDVKRLVALIAEDDRAEPGYVIVSGGAKGVDTTAETEAVALGLKVVSYRVYQISVEEYGIEEWNFGAQQPYVRQMLEEPTFATYDGALNYRNILIVQRADRIVAFWDTASRGTGFALDLAGASGKPTRTYKISEFDRLTVA